MTDNLEKVHLELIAVLKAHGVCSADGITVLAALIGAQLVNYDAEEQETLITKCECVMRGIAQRIENGETGVVVIGDSNEVDWRKVH